MVLLVHGACGGMHEMTPTFGTMWAWPMWSPRQGVHEFGHKTHVASRGGSVVGFCRRKTLENASSVANERYLSRMHAMVIVGYA